LSTIIERNLLVPFVSCRERRPLLPPATRFNQLAEVWRLSSGSSSGQLARCSISFACFYSPRRKTPLVNREDSSSLLLGPLLETLPKLEQLLELELRKLAVTSIVLRKSFTSFLIHSMW
jgi:hypothetical protein